MSGFFCLKKYTNLQKYAKNLYQVMNKEEDQVLIYINLAL